jgi:3-oxoadipate enol-lactonase
MSEPVRLVATLEGPAGAPVVVLGNSLGTTREVWEPQVAALGERFRLLRFEHRGHGGSPAPPGPYTIAELGADVIALLDGLGLRAVSYCGISLGGMIGMWLAAHAPERIGALGLCCTSAYLPPAGFWAGRAEQARAGGMASLSEQVVGRWFTPAFRARDPATVAGFVTTLEGVDPEGYAGCCEAIAALDLRASLGRISAPALVIAGAEDPATPPWHGAQIASAVRGSRLRVIRGGSHLANVSQPGEITAILLAHLTGPPEARRP